MLTVVSPNSFSLALEHVMDKLDAKWGTGKKKSKTSARPSRLRKGITGHNEVSEDAAIMVTIARTAESLSPRCVRWLQGEGGQ